MYDGEEYYYVKNAQGDITGILDSEMNLVVSYTYDSYGNLMSMVDKDGNDVSGNTSHIGNINPYRYRGYYYEAETGFYYLTLRFYDPGLGRYLNADGYVSTGEGILGHNMFAYCDNNPNVYLDNTGCWKEFGRTVYIDDKHTYDTYYSNTNNWQPGEYYVYDPGYSKYYWELNSSKIMEHQKPNFTPRKDKRKGSENRQKLAIEKEMLLIQMEKNTVVFQKEIMVLTESPL